MEPDHLCANLLKWLATFDAGAKVTGPADISDGVIIATVLNQIEPLWFDEPWLNKIKPDVGGNWRLKVSNLRKVAQRINDCFCDSLELSIAHLPQPDVNKLGEENSAEEAGRLLQLVLGVAVNCSRKQEYIESIRTLEPSVQRALMLAIKELMSRGGGGADSVLYAGTLRDMVTDLDTITEERQKIQQRCYELDHQIVLLQDEKSVLQAENVQLQQRLQHQRELTEASTAADGSEQSHRHKQLKEKLAAADDEIYKLEAAREELRMKCDVLEKDLRETQSKNEELQRLADETRLLKDELDILRETSSKVPQYESTLDTYKKRLQEMGDLRRQNKLLEEKNTDYMQHNMELEEELKKSGSYRPQLDLYKKQVAELHGQLSEEAKKRDRAEFDLRKLAEKMTALQSEKERLTAERDQLREANEELRLAQLQAGGAGSPVPGRQELADTLEQIPSDVKEKLARLQHENRQLRSQEEAYRALLDDLRQRDSQLQAENRWASDTQLVSRAPPVLRVAPIVTPHTSVTPTVKLPPSHTKAPATRQRSAPTPAAAAAAPDQVTIRHIHEIKLCTSPEPCGERRASPSGDSGVRLSPNALLREYVDQLVSSASTPRRHSPVLCGHEPRPPPPPQPRGYRSPSAAYTEEYIRRLQDMATSTTELLPRDAPPPYPPPPPPPADDAASVVSDALSAASCRGPQRFTRQGSVKYKQERWPGTQRMRTLKVPARKEDSLDSGCGCSRRLEPGRRAEELDCGSGTTTLTAGTELSEAYLERRLSFIGRYDGQYSSLGRAAGAGSDASEGSLLEDEPIYVTTPSKDSAVGSRATPSLASAEEFHPELARPFSPAGRLAPLSERSPPQGEASRRRRRSLHDAAADSDELQELPTIVRWRSRSFRRPRRSGSRSKSQKRRSRLLETVTMVGATLAMCAP